MVALFWLPAGRGQAEVSSASGWGGESCDISQCGSTIPMRVCERGSGGPADPMDVSSQQGEPTGEGYARGAGGGSGRSLGRA